MISKKLLLASVATIVLFAGGTAVNAETVTETTVVKTVDQPHLNKVDFTAFDINRDGVLSMPEVGEKLFYIFDLDGNEVIDNIEFTKESFNTIIPMEKDTFTFVDYDSDGRADQSAHTKETFLEQSRLIRFDKDKDGLSPKDFIELSFLKMDDNKSGAIELDEWKEEYITKVAPASAEQERYN